MDDMLVLLGRRLLLPLVISVAIVILPFLLLTGGFDYSDGLRFRFILVPVSAVIAGGLLIVGVPAGYFVASRRLGFARSLGLLALIGFGAGFLPASAMVIVAGGGFEGLTVGIVAGLFGTMVSVVWSLSNRDLFRPDNVA